MVLFKYPPNLASRVYFNKGGVDTLIRRNREILEVDFDGFIEENSYFRPQK